MYFPRSVGRGIFFAIIFINVLRIQYTLLYLHTLNNETMFTITLIRDTQWSFIQVTTNAKGEQFTCKHEKGRTGYSNACNAFHTANVAIEIGAQVSYTSN